MVERPAAMHGEMAENLQWVGEQPAVADEGNEEQTTAYSREYVAKVEVELQKICDDIVELMDQGFIPSGSMGELKELHFKMKGDCYRYLVEFATGDAESEAAEDARAVEAEATNVTEKVLVVTHPIRLEIMLNFSVFQSEVLQDPDEARKIFHAS